MGDACLSMSTNCSRRLEVLRTAPRPHATATNPLLSHRAAHPGTSVLHNPPRPSLHFQSESSSPLQFPLHMTISSDCDLITSWSTTAVTFALLGVFCVFAQVWICACNLDAWVCIYCVPHLRGLMSVHVKGLYAVLIEFSLSPLLFVLSLKQPYLHTLFICSQYLLSRP